MASAEIGANIFIVAFMSVWFSGWTVGGTFAVHAFSGCGIQKAAVAVWFVITCTFVYNCIEYGSQHLNVFVWLIAWLLVSFLLTYMKIRFKTVKSAHDAMETLLMRWSQRIDEYVMRIRYALSVWTLKQSTQTDAEAIPLTMITVSAHLASGEPLLSDVKVLSHDHVLALRERVERKLPDKAPGVSCRLVLTDEPLKDSDRLCHAGVEDGSDLTVVIIREEVEKEEEPIPDLPGVATPLPARCFLLFWLCGWCMGEVSVVCAIQRTLLGLDSFA